MKEEEFGSGGKGVLPPVCAASAGDSAGEGEREPESARTPLLLLMLPLSLPLLPLLLGVICMSAVASADILRSSVAAERRRPQSILVRVDAYVVPVLSDTADASLLRLLLLLLSGVAVEETAREREPRPPAAAAATVAVISFGSNDDSCAACAGTGE